MVLWRPTRPSRTNTQKRCPFHDRVLECKSSKSRDTWSNRQVWPWSTKWSRAKTNRVLPENTLLIANTLFQHTREDSTYGHHQMVNTETDWLYIFFCSQSWRSSIQSAKTRPGANCGSDYEYLIAKFRCKLKKAGGNTRLFR